MDNPAGGSRGIGAEDGWQVTQLLYSVARHLDTRNWTALADCVTSDVDCVLGSHGTTRGREEFVANVARMLEPLDLTQHVIGNVVVTGLSEDRAETHCYAIAQHVRSGAPGGETLLVGVQYRDVVVRRDGRWQIENRELSSLWAQGNRQVVPIGR